MKVKCDRSEACGVKCGHHENHDRAPRCEHHCESMGRTRCEEVTCEED